jgi:hypothetical protein
VGGKTGGPPLSFHEKTKLSSPGRIRAYPQGPFDPGIDLKARREWHGAPSAQVGGL